MLNNLGHYTTGSANASRGGVEGENIEMLITINSYVEFQYYFSQAFLDSSWLIGVRQRAIIDGSDKVADGTLVKNANAALLEKNWLQRSHSPVRPFSRLVETCTLVSLNE